MSGDALLVPLPDTVVRLVGDDVRRFSNGMFTNNARDLPLGSGQRTGMCDPKGKLHGLLQLYALSETAFLAVLEGVPAEDFLQRYEKYVIFDDVEMEVLEDHRLHTLQGPAAETVREKAGLPQAGDVTPLSGGGWLLRHDRAGSVGYDLVVPSQAWAELQATLVRAGAHEAQRTDLEVLRVEAGRVRWPEDMQAKPLMHELDLQGEAVSFDKGCYLGQEVLNRVDVMGKLRRGLVGLHIDGDLPPSGAEVRVDGKKVGKITSPVRSRRQGAIGLCVIRKPHDTQGTEVEIVWEAGQASARVASLPFTS